MTVLIEITEEDAAYLWSNQWQPQPLSVAGLVQDLVETAASQYRHTFPESLEKAVSDFRQAKVAHGC